MTEHSATPWRVEQDTDLIWGACNPDDKSSYGMGYAIVEGKSGEKYTGYKPEMDERLANAAFIVQVVNEREALLAEHELMRRTLEIIAGNSADQLQATQARGALANIGPRVDVSGAPTREGHDG